MKLYQIVGLTQTTRSDMSYQTDDKTYILHDKNGQGIVNQRIYTNYILYILLEPETETETENSYYAIHLSTYDRASFSGQLCQIGKMNITHSNYADRANITHFPIKPLSVFANFELKEYDYDEDMYILHDNSDTFVFKFSSIGDDERNPCGYVWVNMKLFQKKI